MIARRAAVVATWLLASATAAWIVADAHYVTDLSAFLPAKPTLRQALLVDQLREGPASRTILVAIEGGDKAARAVASRSIALSLRHDARFTSVENGTASDDRSQELLFSHRYLLSRAVTPQRFSVAGLREALRGTVDELSSATGPLLKSLVPHDPTLEMLDIVDRLGVGHGPRSDAGVWVSADRTRALLVMQTAATGSDTDAQELALDTVRIAARAAFAAAPVSAPEMLLKLSGPALFTVAARAKIKRAAVRLSIASSVLVIAVLLAAYRSIPALLLGLLPVATGALMGIAAVALGFGAVHAITLGFGTTLIGEAVDYSIYFFIQSRRGAHSDSSWQERIWPTIRLGMLTSICGFASLLPSGFPGLAQLGLYSVSGLIAAALVTRYVLIVLLPDDFAVHDVASFGRRLERALAACDRYGETLIWCTALTIAAAAVLVLALHRNTLWNRELAALSPVPSADQAYDAQLRADLGAADVLDLVVVSGADLESTLRAAERAATALEPLIGASVIGGFDSPANYLPSQQTQAARRASLPDAPTLRSNLREATADLNLDVEQLTPFLRDVAAARNAALVKAGDLQGTSLGAGFNSLLIQHADRWNALLPLRSVPHSGGSGLDIERVSATLAASNISGTTVLDLKNESDELYTSYLNEAIRLSLAGVVGIVMVLLYSLRSAARTLRVLAPLLLAVLSVAAALVLCGQQLTILHLVGMLLIVAVGSNYALFFDAAAAGRHAGGLELTLASLLIANSSTVVAFGLLSFSRVPVLEALGVTVAPGAFLALLFSAVLAPRTLRGR